MDNILKYIAEGFEKIITAIKMNGVIAGLVAIIAILLIYSTIINPLNLNNIIENAFDKEKQEQANESQRAMERRIQADATIAPIMEEIVEKYNVSRFMCFELHNNTTNINHRDFLFFSSTLEVLNINDFNLTFISDDFQKESISNNFGSLVNTLRYRDYLYLDDLSECNHRGHQFVRRFRELGAESLLFIPIKDKEDMPELILVFTSKKDSMPYEEIIEAVKPHIKLIKQLLMD